MRSATLSNQPRGCCAGGVAHGMWGTPWIGSPTMGGASPSGRCVGCRLGVVVGRRSTDLVRCNNDIDPCFRNAEMDERARTWRVGSGPADGRRDSVS